MMDETTLKERMMMRKIKMDLTEKEADIVCSALKIQMIYYSNRGDTTKFSSVREIHSRLSRAMKDSRGLRIREISKNREGKEDRENREREEEEDGNDRDPHVLS